MRTEIYIKTIEWRGCVVSAFTVKKGKMENFRCFVNTEGFRTKYGVIPFLPGRETYQSELYALIGALMFAREDKVTVYTHHKAVANWLNWRECPEHYGDLFKYYLEIPVKVTAEQMDYGRSKVMNGMLTKAIEFCETKQKI